MNNLEVKNLLLSEVQVSDELSAEDLETIAGGNLFIEGLRDFGQGLADGLGGRNDEESNLPYLGGHIAGGLLNVVGLGKGK